MGIIQSKGWFNFGGESSESFGIYTAGSGTFDSPSRDFEDVVIPGRNGTVTLDYGRFKNVKVVYTILCKENFKQQAENVKAWLLSKTGFQRLEDSFDTEHYRLARFEGSINWTIGQLLRYGYTDITFVCRPERFLKSGETAVEYTDNTNIVNPTRFTAKPIFTIYGTGTDQWVLAGGNIMSISSISGSLTYDAETMNAYKGTTNLNNRISFQSSENLTIGSGRSAIGLSSGLTKVEIQGRWWTV